MADKTIVPTGTTVAFGTSTFTMYLDSIELNGRSREAINTSHMGTTANHTFTPADLVDNGTVTLNGHFNPDNEPPINGAAETVTITFPLESGETTNADWEFTAFVVSQSASLPKEDKATGSIELQITGDIAVTAAT